MTKKSSSRGLDAFNHYFQPIYGERWPTLLEALQKPSTHFALESPFTSKTYHLDEASVIAAGALPIKPGDRVLDMCAAPGGKALTLLFRADSSNHFVLNERSATRRGRLQKVLSDYLGATHGFDIKVSGHDATKWCLYEKDAYNAILLDAPCSSERHLLEKPALMKEWSAHRTKVLALQQFAMLASAGDAIKVGGHILYATSISPAENDDVIAKLLKRREQFEVVPIQFDKGEATPHGWIFLPDASGIGPLYVSLVRRNPTQ
jgi:16S rRNA C967 or C1407 C5-methylase (RsmB/RsmF family)